MLSCLCKRYYEPLRLPSRVVCDFGHPYTHPLVHSRRPPAWVSRPALLIFRCVPPLLRRDISQAPFVVLRLTLRPSPSDHRVGISNSSDEATSKFACAAACSFAPWNSQPPITRTLLHFAMKANEQFLQRDFNPQG
jgi:hypothetical protein